MAGNRLWIREPLASCASGAIGKNGLKIPSRAALTGVGIPVALMGGAISVFMHKQKKSKERDNLAFYLNEELPNSFIENVVEPTLIPALHETNAGRVNGNGTLLLRV